MDISGKNKMIRSLLLISLLIHTTLAKKHGQPQAIEAQENVATQPQDTQTQATIPTQKWPTLSGNQPLVIGRGGFSGLFPEGSPDAIKLATDTSLQGLVILCNLQMTKDAVGICLTGIKLDKATSIADFDANGTKTYNVNGKDVQGYFSVDYTMEQLANNVTLTQAIYSRPTDFDGSPILSIDDVLAPAEGYTPPKRFWLNVQYEAFYTQHGIKMADYVLDTVNTYRIEFLSSPEIAFLKSISGKVNKATTKIVFQLLNASDVESTTKQPYSTIVKDLATIKSFASGILVPKDYIKPVKPDKYLGPPTTLLADAHKLGLEVYVSGFANDLFSSYNYSYDPVVEYLHFMDKVDSVDGVVTDYPVTASETIACFANTNPQPKKGQALIITMNGASSVYPGCTDLAYEQAIDDGADIIDCSVQMTKDGVAFCLNSTDLTGVTNAMNTMMSRTTNVPEIQSQRGIFSFDLTWSEITEKLKPQIASPFTEMGFVINPANKNTGKFVTLAQFLELAKTKAVTGILINIENAAYLASKKGLDIVGAVSTALSNATFDKQSTQQVLIQSDDTSVLSKFKDVPSYTRVLYNDEIINDAPRQSVEDIKKFANAVNLRRGSIIEATAYTTRSTNIVKEMKDANITVFVHCLRNEYVTLAFDYFADPYIEIATFVQNMAVDGIVTEYPATSSRYMRSSCSNPNPPPDTYTILAANPGELATSLLGAQTPAEAPVPLENVVDPPLPPVTDATKQEPRQEQVPPPSPPRRKSGARANVANLGLSLVAVLVFGILSAGH